MPIEKEMAPMGKIAPEGKESTGKSDCEGKASKGKETEWGDSKGKDRMWGIDSDNDEDMEEETAESNQKRK